MENDINTNGQIGQEAVFNPADVNPEIPNDIQIKIAKLILAWAKLDARTSHLLYQFFRLPYDLGEILTGRMSIRDKHFKIMTLLHHFGADEKQHKKFLKLIEEWIKVRNTVCHSDCLGISIKDRPGWVVFVKSEVMRGRPIYKAHCVNLSRGH